MAVLRSIATLAFMPKPWRLPCWIALGVLVGLGLGLVRMSRMTSYLSDAPETCVNCHVMHPQYSTWQHSSHREASCNDCHVPHTNMAATYGFKAMDGLKHASVYTAHLEPQVIRLSETAVPVVQANCVRCHNFTVHESDVTAGGTRLCWDCHREVPHGTVRSLSATPRIMTPDLPAIGERATDPAIRGRAPRAAEQASDQ